MMRIARLLVSICLVLVISACQSAPDDRDSWLASTSLVMLLANPSEYKNIHVETMGFLAYYGDPIVFLTRDHAKAHDALSGVPLTVPDEELKSLRNAPCFDKYVDVTGRFVLDNELPPNAIQVQEIRDAITNKTCWQGK